MILAFGISTSLEQSLDHWRPSEWNEKIWRIWFSSTECEKSAAGKSASARIGGTSNFGVEHTAGLFRIDYRSQLPNGHENASSFRAELHNRVCNANVVPGRVSTNGNGLTTGQQNAIRMRTSRLGRPHYWISRLLTYLGLIEPYPRTANAFDTMRMKTSFIYQIKS